MDWESSGSDFEDDYVTDKMKKKSRPNVEKKKSVMFDDNQSSSSEESSAPENEVGEEDLEIAKQKPANSQQLSRYDTNTIML